MTTHPATAAPSTITAGDPLVDGRDGSSRDGSASTAPLRRVAGAAGPGPSAAGTTGPVERVVVVCLPPDTATADLAAHARDALAVSPFAPGTPSTLWNPAVHFAVRRRLRGRWLVGLRGRVAAGGPIRLLDLTRMRLAARAGAWHRWQVWHRVVSGTPRATPWWVYAARHRTAPDQYPLVRARQDYAGQPRIHAMRVHNLLISHPHPPVPDAECVYLPTADLEAFQAGAHVYAHAAYLDAVAPHGLLTVDRTPLRPASDQLADRLTYLHAACAHLTALTSHHRVLALAAAPPPTS